MPRWAASAGSCVWHGDHVDRFLLFHTDSSDIEACTIDARRLKSSYCVMLGYLNRSTIARISTRHIHDLTREFTPRSNARTVKDQYPWHDGQERTDPA